MIPRNSSFPTLQFQIIGDMLLSLAAGWVCPPNWGLQRVAEGVLLRAEKSSLAQPISACSGQLAGLVCVRERWRQPHKAKENDAKSCFIMFQKYNWQAWTLGRLSLVEIVQEADFTGVLWGFASPFCSQDLLSAQVFQGSESNSKMGSTAPHLRRKLWELLSGRECLPAILCTWVWIEWI